MNLFADHFSETICAVDVAELVAWLEKADNLPWIIQAYPDSPQRLFQLPGMVRPIIDHVLGQFPLAAIAQEVVLSRMMPGQSHDYHIDRQNTEWLTRVHVPLLSNDLAWLRFEEQKTNLLMPVGQAYTFNTERRHSFGNNGETPRVHLIFDAMRK